MLDTTFHRTKLEAELKNKEFRTEYQRARAELAQVNRLVQELNALRVDRGFSKAALARETGRNDAAIRRLFTAEANPELRTVIALATAMGGEIQIVWRKKGAGRLAAARPVTIGPPSTRKRAVARAAG